jgi:hypothetical protein
LGAGALFWMIFPVWLSLFWSVQGYPPTLRDLPRWYALGVFNIAPIVGMVLTSPLVLGVVIAARRWTLIRSFGIVVLGAVLYALLAPPIAYALLLIYADMWQYRAWDVMMPTLLRAYLLLAPVCGVVGAFVGWTLRR